MTDNLGLTKKQAEGILDFVDNHDSANLIYAHKIREFVETNTVEPKKKYIYLCPKCGSSNICQYRMPTGAMWCGDCSFKVEEKQIDHSFRVYSE